MILIRSRLTISILVLATCFGSSAWSQQPTDWLSGKTLELQAKSAPISLDWQAAPLRQRLTELSARQRISVVLDRRIDGSQPIKFSVSNVSFEQLLWKLADHLGAGMCRVEDIYYIGPKSAAAALPMDVDRLKQSVAQGRDRRQKRTWQRLNTLSMDRLCQPREIMRQQAIDSQLQFVNLESIPHDLWDRGEIGNCSLTTRLVLLTIGFGKTVEVEPDLTEVKIVEIPERTKLTRKFANGSSSKSFVSELSKRMPNLQVDRNSRSVTVTGTADEVLSAHRILVASQKPKVAELSDQRFSLKATDKRGNILNSIAFRLNRKLRYEQHHLEQLNTRIELELKDAPLSELMSKTLDGSGLKYRLTEDSLEIID